MPTRPDVVKQVHNFAFDAIAATTLPDDITPQEQAEGLISLALAVLREDAATSAALTECLGMLGKHQNDRVLG